MKTTVLKIVIFYQQIYLILRLRHLLFLCRKHLVKTILCLKNFSVFCSNAAWRRTWVRILNGVCGLRRRKQDSNYRSLSELTLSLFAEICWQDGTKPRPTLKNTAF